MIPLWYQVVFIGVEWEIYGSEEREKRKEHDKREEELKKRIEKERKLSFLLRDTLNITYETLYLNESTKWP